MIRRHVQGAFALISQHDHATVAGQLAGHVGNRAFDIPSRRESWALAVGLHDCGWPLHDDAPTLTPDGLPRDVFESTPAVALRVWQASADRAMARDAYAGLLVSLHSLSLSIMACSRNAGAGLDSFDLTNPHVRFAVNKFQHREIERQEQLRGVLGLRTDIPLLHGLADPGQDGREDQLTFHIRWLQALDLMSLALCCTAPPAPTTNDVYARPNGRAVRFGLARKGDTTLVVTPWPFDVSRITLDVPYKRVREGPFNDEVALHAASAAAPVDFFRFFLQP